MSTTTTASPAHHVPARASATVRELALVDAKRFARHPLFVIGVTATAILTVPIARLRDPSPIMWTVLAALLIGVLGFVVAHRLTTALRRSDEVVDSLPSSERRRTVALCLACVVPLVAGTLCTIEFVVLTELFPPRPIPADAPVTWFGDPSTTWLPVAATLIALGPVAFLGGPLLGVAVARWAPFRGSALLGSVLLVLGCAFPAESALPWRALPPWGAIFDEHVTDNQVSSSTFIPGLSEVWYLAYVLLLCSLAVVAALLHDRHNRRPLLWTGAALAVAAAGAFALTVT